MSSAEYDATPDQIRKFALLQIGLTAGFFVLLFFMLGGSDADFPPIWLVALLIVLIGVGAYLAEQVWHQATPFPADTRTAEIRQHAVDIFAGQTVRKLTLTEVPMLFAVLVAFIGDYGGWPLVIAGFPGLIVLTWEVWPSLRNVTLSAAMLDAHGAETYLVESFAAA